MADKNLKLRNLKFESRYTMIVNMLVMVVIALVIFMFFPYSEKIGARNAFFINALFVSITYFLMYVLEKFSAVISGMYEKNLITVLSHIYTFCIIQFANLILFMSKTLLIMNVIHIVLSVLLVILSDVVLTACFNNKNKYRKPRMMIVSTNPDNYLRAKRIKYGIINLYDPWYECIQDFTIDQFELFLKENFTKYDAVCILDGLTDKEYNVAVNTAVKMNKELFVVPKMVDVGKTNASLVRFDDVLTFHMPDNEITEIEFFIKRAMDILISLVASIIAFVPMLVIAALIKITSPGPVFYKQERLTINKKPFMIYKFRTMIPDAEKLSGPKFAEKDDPRITKIGKILRACRLDELPQILNILKGDMSIVGPRPERPVFVDKFEDEIENYDYRFAVKAGLTSLSHVYGRYSTYIHDRTYYDLFYITNYSFWLDIKIILLTTKTMFMKDAAEGVTTVNGTDTSVNSDKKEAQPVEK